MADTQRDPRQVVHSPPPPSVPRTPPRPPIPPVRPSTTGSDSLSSILKGIRKLAGELRRSPAAQGYAQQADILADRLKRVI
jgi:hypothetical protein